MRPSAVLQIFPYLIVGTEILSLLAQVFLALGLMSLPILGSLGLLG